MPFDEKAYQKKYRETHREEKLAYNRKYYQENKERMKADARKYHHEHLEERKAYVRTLARKKIQRICKWRSYGLKYDGSFDDLHDRYEATQYCELCNHHFTGDNKNNYDRKVVEHDHLSGYVRWICCQRCNLKVGNVDNRRKDVLLGIHRRGLLQ